MGASCQESQSRSRSWSWLESRAGVRGAGHVWQPRVRFKVEVWKRKRKRKRCGSRSGDHTLSRHQAANSRERCNAIAGPVVSVRAKGSGAAIIAVGLGRGCASDAPSGEGLGNNGGGLEDEGTDVARKGSEWLAQSVQVGASRAVQVGRCESSPAVAAVQLGRFVCLGKVDREVGFAKAGIQSRHKNRCRRARVVLADTCALESVDDDKQSRGCKCAGAPVLSLSRSGGRVGLPVWFTQQPAPIDKPPPRRSANFQALGWTAVGSRQWAVGAGRGAKPTSAQSVLGKNLER